MNGTQANAGNTMSPRTAVVAGASGLIGRQLLGLLLEAPAYGRVIALVRRPLDRQHDRLHDKLEAREAAFDRLPQVLADLHGAAVDVFCCLGTTIKAAGSEAAFRRVDHDYVLALGTWAKAAQVRRLLVISALGADAASGVFYNRVKGETERDLRALGLSSLVILRPSLLDGDRAEWRLGERIALAATRPFRALIPARVRPVHARDVAAAMVAAALADAPAALVESAAMQGAAQRAHNA